MQLDQGATIMTQDGKAVGHIDRMVIDPRTKKLTHVVVRKGLLFSKDRVVPMDLINASDTGHVTLQLDAHRFDELPEYEETKFVEIDEEDLSEQSVSRSVPLTSALYWYPNYSGSPGLTMPHPAPPYVAEKQLNIPPDSVAVKKGAKVLTHDGKDVGRVEQVLTGAAGDRVTHFLVTHGVLQKETKVIPIEWVNSMMENELQLAVGARTVERLPAFEPA